MGLRPAVPSPALLVLYTRRHMPETPRYLVSKARTADANRSLSVLASGRMNPRGLVVTDYLPDGLRLTEEKARWTEILKAGSGATRPCSAPAPPRSSAPSSCC